MKALLIRHAQSTHQAPDAPLSDLGTEQAERLVATLANLGAGPLYSSPYRRAQDTIAPYAAASAQVVTVLDKLRERLLSPVPLPDWQDHIARSFDDPDHAPEGGESHNDLGYRANVALKDIMRRGGAMPAFVTHGGLASCLFHQVNSDFGIDGWRSLRNPDLFAIDISGGKITAFERLDMEHAE